MHPSDNRVHSKKNLNSASCALNLTFFFLNSEIHQLLRGNKGGWKKGATQLFDIAYA